VSEGRIKVYYDHVGSVTTGRRRVFLIHDGMGVPITPDDLSTTGKDACFERVSGKRLSLDGSVLI
jgi:hypothetical protein